VRREFAEGLRHTILNSLQLSPEIVDFSNEEAQALENYLYANYLIIQCKESALRVSPTTWAGIEEQMLLPPKK